VSLQVSPKSLSHDRITRYACREDGDYLFSRCDSKRQGREKLCGEKYDSIWLVPCSALAKCNKLPRFEEIHDSLIPHKVRRLVRRNPPIFISHKWAGDDPDPGDEIINWCKESEKCGIKRLIWIDYCCTPQDEVDIEEIATAIRSLGLSYGSIGHSYDICVFTGKSQEAYERSAWCNVEFALAGGKIENPIDVLTFRDEKSKNTFVRVMDVLLEDSNLNPQARANLYDFLKAKSLSLETLSV
jgi:hypothetical protein